MSATVNTNMRKTYFKHQQPTLIQGKPNVSKLHSMLLQLKVNAISVPSTLGEAAHSYVDVILLPVTYATLAPMDPFIPPTHPNTLDIVHGGTQYEIVFVKS